MSFLSRFIDRRIFGASLSARERTPTKNRDQREMSFRPRRSERSLSDKDLRRIHQTIGERIARRALPDPSGHASKHGSLPPSSKNVLLRFFVKSARWRKGK